MRIIFFIALITLLPSLGMAQALLYSREHITVERKAVPAVPLLPWQDQSTPRTPQDPAIIFDVEVREASTLYRQEGWYNLSSPLENGGVLMVFATSGIAPISPSPQYVPLDILMINSGGMITQIVPGIKLSQLDRDIMPESDVLAFMFIKGGMCKKLSIHPGDVVEYKAFHKPPVVLSTPDTFKDK